MTDYNINKIINDIQNLQDQNSYDFQEIKRLDRLIKDYDKRVLQAINFNNLINKKNQDNYEKIKTQIALLLDRVKQLEDNTTHGSGGSGEIITPSLSSISVVYTQGSTVVTPSTSLDSLKNNLVVTAMYSNGSTQTITDYTLSGSLSLGISTITVSYNGKTSTFNVNVSGEIITPSTPPSPSTLYEVDIYGGNSWENNNFIFKKGYNYELTPISDCSFNSLTEVTNIDATSQDANPSLRGHYKVKSFKNNTQINPPLNFVRTAASILYPVVTKIEGLNDIVFVGDSLTDINFSESYNHYVTRLFSEYGAKYNFVSQLATYGHTSDQQSTVLDRYKGLFAGNSNGYFDVITDHSNAKIVSIFTGTNEINQQIDISTFETNYSNLVDKVKETFSKARVICITPFLCCKQSNNIDYINKVKLIASSKECAICDLSTFTQLDSVKNGQNEYYLETECIHLTKAGWTLVYPTIKQSFVDAGLV